MLVEGFFVPVLEGAAVDELRDDLCELVAERLHEQRSFFPATRVRFPDAPNRRAAVPPVHKADT
ncbi:hypothetical protein [Halosimplex salinum]|uniref:hypothetical protein n=1 Tax=Halosimplex salinum TaxID=1710538 RepID=UPI000F4A8D15|nr:hypothetical protein [Halosimplex salinum]